MNWIYSVDSSSCHQKESRINYSRAQNLFEAYLKQNGYDLSYNHYYNCNANGPCYKWDYLKITNIYPYTELPYNPGDVIYFVPRIELDEFRSSSVAADWANFRFVDKTHFYKWGRLKSDSDASPIQFKNLNIGDIFKIPSRDFLYMKVDPFAGDRRWGAVVLTGDKKGYTITLTPEANVEIVRDLNDIPAECCKGSNSLKKLASKYLKDDKDSFMTYGGVDYNKIANDTFNYSYADVKNTLRFLELCQDYKRVSVPCIKKVIFNDPATIVFWRDGSKTVVKAQNGEKYDKEKGLALCYMKKMLGNKSNFNNIFREWIITENCL